MTEHGKFFIIYNLLYLCAIICICNIETIAFSFVVAGLANLYWSKQ